MDEITATQSKERPPTHPGAVLEDMLEDVEIEINDLVERLEVSRQQLYDIRKEKKPVSPKIAGKLGRFFGNGAGIWLRLQANYDAYYADRDDALKSIKPYAA